MSVLDKTDLDKDEHALSWHEQVKEMKILPFSDDPLQIHIRRIAQYKGDLDTALVATSRGRASPEQNVWLSKEGFIRVQPNGTGVNPETFVRWVFGSFRVRARQPVGPEISEFPRWGAIGWNRRQYSAVTCEEARAMKLRLDASTTDESVSDGYATWLKPLPVVIAGEAKHRIDLHRQHGLNMMARQRIDESLLLTNLNFAEFGADTSGHCAA